MKICFLIISFLCSNMLYARSNSFPSTGNVGIGTTEPALMFTLKRMINNGDAISILRSDNTANLDIYSNYNGLSDLQTGSFAYGVRPSDDSWQIWERGQNLSWVNLFSVKKDGNVGIGTTNPIYKLDVQGGAVNINLDNFSALGGQITVSNGHGSQNGSVRLNLRNGNAISWIKGVVTGTNTNTGSAIVFGVPSNSSDGVERMRITSSGDVGIGTDNPNGYKLAVAGKVRAQEIKVEMANWPDYVFDKSYHLRSLSETESHIKAKGHLPGIPTAVEVKASGIDLGEMNAKLLQKIEELTLYLIELKKENFEMSRSVQGLNVKIDRMNNKLKNNR